MKIDFFSDGIAILGDCLSTEVKDFIRSQSIDMIVVDPPYGNIVSDTWDRVNSSDDEFVNWMLDWTNVYADMLSEGSAFYVWGGYGIPNFRPFFKYIVRAENETPLKLANFLTWKKKRARGTSTNYLSTREELGYFVKGKANKPRVFNIPLLDEKRGYAGYNKKYPAKSEFYRRTSVWTDITEIFRSKSHTAQKPVKVIQIPIETNTLPGETVLDLFAGSMTTAWACRETGRKWICVEKDEKIFNQAVKDLRESKRNR